MNKDDFKPVWDEELNGVYIPILNVVIDKADHKEDAYEISIDWRNAMTTALSTGKRLLSKEEWQFIRIWKDEINNVLKEHGGQEIKGYYWTSSQNKRCGRQNESWYINFDTGKTIASSQDYALYVRLVTLLPTIKQTDNKPKSTSKKKPRTKFKVGDRVDYGSRTFTISRIANFDTKLGWLYNVEEDNDRLFAEFGLTRSIGLEKYTPVMVSDNGKYWEPKLYLEKILCIDYVDTNEKLSSRYKYIVPTSDFDFNDIESNIKKNILLEF